jgi:hypothetical protein
MSRTCRWCEIAAAVPVLAVFATLYAWAAPFGDPTQRFDAYLWIAAAFAMPTVLWLVTSWLLVHHWWEGAGAQLSTLADPPGRLMATAVATLPEARQPWGAAMLGELAHVRGRRARWRFALSCGRAVLFLPIARRRGLRGRSPAPAATVLVTGAVAVSVATTVVFVRRHPEAAEGLPPGRIALLAVILAGCLWLAMARPRRSAGNRPGRSGLAPHLGVAAAFIFDLVLLASIHSNLDGLVQLWLLFGPALTFVVPAVIAATVACSFRAGVRAGTWTAITVMPLTFALLLAEASRQYANDGEWLFAGDVTTAGFSVSFAVLIFVAIPMIGFPFAVIGAAVGEECRGATP